MTDHEKLMKARRELVAIYSGMASSSRRMFYVHLALAGGFALWAGAAWGDSSAIALALLSAMYAVSGLVQSRCRRFATAMVARQFSETLDDLGGIR